MRNSEAPFPRRRYCNRDSNSGEGWAHCNSGYCNSGYCNRGYCNSGEGARQP